MMGKSVKSVVISLYMAGDCSAAKLAIQRRGADEGLCYSVFECEYIYSFGCERGFEVRAINYPRFPTEESEMLSKMESLAHDLMLELGQGSYTIAAPKVTTFYSRRPTE